MLLIVYLKKIINTIFSFQSIISCENSEILKSLPIIESSQIEEIENWSVKKVATVPLIQNGLPRLNREKRVFAY